MDKLISRKDICDKLGVSRTTLFRRIQEFDIKPVENKLFKQKLLYRVKDIEKALDVKLSDDEDQGSFLDGDNDVKNILEEE